MLLPLKCLGRHHRHQLSVLQMYCPGLWALRKGTWSQHVHMLHCVRVFAHVVMSL